MRYHSVHFIDYRSSSLQKR